MRTPKPTVAASNSSLACGSSSALACSKRTGAAIRPGGTRPLPCGARSPASARRSRRRRPRRCRADRPGERKRQSPVPVATSSTRLAGPDLRQLDRAVAPAVVQPGGHHRVEAVIDAGDAIEHRPNLRFGERARLGAFEARMDRAIAERVPAGPRRQAARGGPPAAASSRATEGRTGTGPGRRTSSATSWPGPRTTASAPSGSSASRRSPPRSAGRPT